MRSRITFLAGATLQRTPPALVGWDHTPSLRNIGVTAPRLHDGSAPTIEAAITAQGMAYQPPGSLPSGNFSMR